MATTTQVTTIDATVPGDFYGDYAADFDTDAINTEYRATLEALAQQIVPSVSIAANGMVFADLDEADLAADINWRDLSNEIDLTPIVQRHEITTRD